MSRRRLTLRAYVRRRWRVVGAVLVLLLGALLVLGITDRGHDPLWEVRSGPVAQAALAPDASVVYALVSEGGSIARLAAYSGHDGALLWDSSLPSNITRALVAAGPEGAAVATDFPYGFLTVYTKDGAIDWHVPLEGNPVALVMEGNRLALALNAPSAANPVFLFEGQELVRTFHHASRVNSLHMAQGLVAVATDGGDVVVRAPNGTELANATLGFSPRSLHLSRDGTTLVVGGYGFPSDVTRGHLAFLDVGADPPLRWQQSTLVGIGLVDLDAAGLLALAVEESPGSATLHVYEGSTGATRWTRLLAESVSRDGAGLTGGAALSPDAGLVAVGTQNGDVRVFDARSGDEAWSYRAAGATLATFADAEEERLLVGGRLVANRPFDSLLLFDADGEPLLQHAGALASAFVAAAAASLALLLGVGFRRARGPY